MSVHLQFRKNQETSLVYVPFGESLSRAKNFAAGLSKYTTASLPHVWATVQGSLNVAEKSGDLQDLNLYAHVFFRRVRDGKLYALKIPAPNYNEVFNDDQEVPENIGSALAVLYSTLAGETFTFHCGALVGKGVE